MTQTKVDHHTHYLALVEIRDLKALIAESVPVVDELCAWIDTDLIGCVEVQERGEALLLRLRKEIDRV